MEHQFDLLYVSQVFEGNIYKYTLIGVNIASRCKGTGAFKTNKTSRVVFVLEVIYKKVGMFKYPKVLQCDNGNEFQSIFKNVNIQRTTKHRHSNIAVEEAFNK